jgi:hypothetical protein
MGAVDLLKSERGIMNLIFLGVLAALMFTHADKATIDTWALYAGGVTAIYTAAKSLKPNDAKLKTGVAEVQESKVADASDR